MNLQETIELFQAMSNQKLFDLINTIQSSATSSKRSKVNNTTFIWALQSELKNFLRD